MPPKKGTRGSGSRTPPPPSRVVARRLATLSSSDGENSLMRESEDVPPPGASADSCSIFKGDDGAIFRCWTPWSAGPYSGSRPEHDCTDNYAIDGSHWWPDCSGTGLSCACGLWDHLSGSAPDARHACAAGQCSCCRGWYPTGGSVVISLPHKLAFSNGPQGRDAGKEICAVCLACQLP